MALSAPNTPRSQYTTPKRLGKENYPPQTPECFRQVTVETPVSTKRTSRDKNSKSDKISNLQVAVRIRPMNARELACVGVYDVVTVNEDDVTLNVNSSTTNLDHLFQYDHIFWSCDETNRKYVSQETVFNVIGEPLLDSAFRGYNACLFAYGQTGSGKSYSMMGQHFGEVIDIDVNAGIIPRFCKNLFARLSELGPNCTSTVEISYFEIYNEKIHNLLASTPALNRQPLKVREHPVWGPYVVDLSVHSVSSYKELKNFLMLGNKNRATAATSMNDNSSRSHSIFTIEISLSEGDDERMPCRRSKVNLVDLAGSERLGNNEHNGERIKQGVSINKSLLTLRKVITALAEKGNQFVPYRESVLTWLLRESLGGNSLTCMLATITPSSTNIEETLATLRYACQARSIINRACVNENPNDKLIRELRAEVGRLRALRQDYERTSIGSIPHINNSIEYEQELEDLRQKLGEKEDQLIEAQLNWEQRLLETKQKQMEELAEAERRKIELESHVRILSRYDEDVTLSPYQSDFLKEVENVLEDRDKKQAGITKAVVTESMNQIYNILAGLRPAIDDNSDEKLLLTFAKANKALQAFEAALTAKVKTNQKTVTFKL